jgi:hypothetical protein
MAPLVKFNALVVVRLIGAARTAPVDKRSRHPPRTGFRFIPYEQLAPRRLFFKGQTAMVTKAPRVEASD